MANHKDRLKELLGKIAITTNTITAEDDINHYTVLELLNALRSNVTEINKILDNLDGEIKEEVKRLIDNGTLERLINDDLLGEINAQLSYIKSKTLFMSEIQREEGEQDDTGRIRRAFDMVRTKGYKTIFFNSGDYVITPPTNLSEYGIAIPNNVKLIGEDGAKIKTQSAVAYPALFTLDIGDGAENVCIENIEFDNTEDTHKTFPDSDKNACMLKNMRY